MKHSGGNGITMFKNTTSALI